MRQIEETFAARLAAGVTTLCACWRFERIDGAVFGATDHDESIVFDGVRYEPAAGLESATFDTSAGLAPGHVAARGAISLAFLTEADVDAGLWDGARVDVWRVDWAAPEYRVTIWSGQLSEISRRGDAFSAELVSLKAAFERPIGRVYARTCDAEVGDARCGVDLGGAAFRAEAVVVAVLGNAQVQVSGLAGFDGGWFTAGRLVWTTGDNAGAIAHIQQHRGAEIDLVRAPRFATAVGDACVVTAGCDKSFATCGAKFDARLNFRGFPHMPGPEAVLAGPASDRPNDGGRRA